MESKEPQLLFSWLRNVFSKETTCPQISHRESRGRGNPEVEGIPRSSPKIPFRPQSSDLKNKATRIGFNVIFCLDYLAMSEDVFHVQKSFGAKKKLQAGLKPHDSDW